jgi:hypothetical protein
MAKYTMDMVLEYAKVFPENADMGDENGNNTQKSIHAKGGQYIVNAYFTSQDQIDQLLSDGMNPRPLSDRVLVGNQEFGIGKFMKLKREVEDKIKTFENKKRGDVTVNFGGPVGVVDLTNGAENKKWWSFAEDGPLGNGTRAMVQFEMYANGAGLRLKNIGVTNHVPYETNGDYDNSADEMFKVA